MHAHQSRAFRAFLHTFPLLLIAVLGSGCGIFSPDESKDGGGGGTPVEYPTAVTPDIMLGNFEKAWENLNILEYDKVLHESFVFWFADDDIASNNIGEFWDRASDMESAENMFSGRTGLRKNEEGQDEVIPAILSFDMTLDVVEPWRSDFTDGEEFAAADFRGRYRVNMTVRYADASRVTTVSGLQDFYVKRVEAQIDGQVVDVYQLFAWKDQGKDSAGS